MSDKKPFPLELDERQIDYLQKMAEKHGLPDAAKAIRCLVNYAIHSPQQEETIFATVRCLDC